MNTINNRGIRNLRVEAKEKIVVEITKRMKTTLDADDRLVADWAFCHPGPLTKDEELVERFVTAYLNEVALEASTSRREILDSKIKKSIMGSIRQTLTQVVRDKEKQKAKPYAKTKAKRAKKPKLSSPYSTSSTQGTPLGKDILA
uniref:Uncharacterized protein n=1 Tax=Cannabis sativa TaxID=3483 RepID=A0A803QHK3_CANSA